MGAGHSVIPLTIPSSSVAATLCLASPSRKIAAVASVLPGDRASVTSAHSFSIQGYKSQDLYVGRWVLTAPRATRGSTAPTARVWSAGESVDCRVGQWSWVCPKVGEKVSEEGRTLKCVEQLAVILRSELQESNCLSQTSTNVQCPACVAMVTVSTTLALIAVSVRLVIAWVPHVHSALVRLGDSWSYEFTRPDGRGRASSRVKRSLEVRAN